MFFEEELLNNVMDRYYHELDEDTYRKISMIFMEEHLKLLKKHDKEMQLRYKEVEKIMDNMKEYTKL
jgi:hypothetical protein